MLNEAQKATLDLLSEVRRELDGSRESVDRLTNLLEQMHLRIVKLEAAAGFNDEDGAGS